MMSTAKAFRTAKSTNADTVVRTMTRIRISAIAQRYTANASARTRNAAIRTSKASPSLMLK